MEGTLNELTSISALEDALARSNERPVLIFKHSSACPISARALREFKAYLEEANSTVSYNLITVQTARSVSNEVAERLSVVHETPQAILIREGKEVWNASHFAITSRAIAEAIRQATE